MKIKEALLIYPPQLSKISDVPILEIELLLSQVLGKEKEFLIQNPEVTLTKVQFEEFENFVKRRTLSEPLSYILGYKEFYGLRFVVNKNVLIPRPETEILIEKSLEAIFEILKDQSDRNIKIYELATGSGAIIISVAHELQKRNIKNIELTAGDISEKALEVAKRNAEKLLGKHHRINFKKEDIMKIEKLDGKDLPAVLISNPPYIPTKEIGTLDDDVKDFEPMIALDGGIDGLKFYRKIFELIKISTIPFSIIEIHSAKAGELSNLKEEIKLTHSIEILKDLSGKNRAILLTANMPAVKA